MTLSVKTDTTKNTVPFLFNSEGFGMPIGGKLKAFKISKPWDFDEQDPLLITCYFCNYTSILLTDSIHDLQCY